MILHLFFPLFPPLFSSFLPFFPFFSSSPSLSVFYPPSLLQQQKAQTEALQTGAVNEDAQEVVVELNRSLAEQTAATAALLEQPARPAFPVVPPPEMSLGPQPVTDRERAEERAEEPRAGPSSEKKVTPKKEERQKRASARMLELGGPSNPGKDSF